MAESSAAGSRPVDDEVVPASRLRSFTEDIFARLGMPRPDARLMAEALVWADLHGIPQQGTVRKVPQCLARVNAGGTAIGADLRVVAETPASLVLDAQDGWGQVAASRAMAMAVEKARMTGIGLAVVRNTTYAGCLGYHAMAAVREGMIGLAVNNSLPLQAPWGGTTAVLGNQAFALGCPAGRHPPVLFDAATTAITWARIHEYQARGEPLPEAVALDARGLPTTDPVAALTGLLLPAGGHRGYGLAVMWEVLTGVLAGGTRFGPRLTGPDEFASPMAVSVFLLAIDPSLSTPRAEFVERVDQLVDDIHASPPAPGVERVLVPGERGFALADARERTGIPLPRSGIDRLRRIGQELGVAW